MIHGDSWVSTFGCSEDEKSDNSTHTWMHGKDKCEYGRWEKLAPDSHYVREVSIKEKQ